MIPRRNRVRRTPRRNRRRNRVSGARTNPSPNVLVYTGPRRPRGASGQNACYTVEMSLTISVASTSGGLINNVINNNPAGFLNFSSYSTIFSECRVLNMTVMWVPNAFETTSTFGSPSPFVGVFDRANVSAAITGYPAAWDYDSSKTCQIGQPKTFYCKMDGADNAGFQSVASTSANWAFKCYCSNLSISSGYGYFMCRMLVQWRSRD